MGDALCIDREIHYIRKINYSLFINALDPPEKHTNIMNLEKGVKKKNEKRTDAFFLRWAYIFILTVVIN